MKIVDKSNMTARPDEPRKYCTGDIYKCWNEGSDKTCYIRLFIGHDGYYYWLDMKDGSDTGSFPSDFDYCVFVSDMAKLVIKP